MNANDIIKALKYFIEHNERNNASCDGCILEKHFPYCNRECCEDTLYVVCLDLINRQKAEARAEAIKEFAEKVKKNQLAIFNTIYSGLDYREMIDKLVKEMTEGEYGNV